MAARIRLKRIGRKNRPSYRICVFDARTRRDGAPIEELGSYDPTGKSIDEKVKLDKERALHWLSVGAQPSDTVASVFRKLGVRKGQPLAAPAAPAAGAS
jgi:small subunit ribosomal protein S16